jgi:hypothetical protein
LLLESGVITMVPRLFPVSVHDVTPIALKFNKVELPVGTIDDTKLMDVVAVGGIQVKLPCGALLYIFVLLIEATDQLYVTAGVILGIVTVVGVWINAGAVPTVTEYFDALDTGFHESVTDVPGTGQLATSPDGESG